MDEDRAFDTRAHALAAGAGDASASASELARASWLAVIGDRLDDAAALAARGIDVLGSDASEAEDLVLRGLQAMVRVLRGDSEADHELLDDLRQHVDEFDGVIAMLEIANWYTFVDRFDDAGRVVAHQTERARRSGDTAALIWSLGCSAELDLRRGRWRQCRRDLVEALMISERENSRAGNTHVLLARLAAYQGDTVSARHHLAMARRDAIDVGDRLTIWRADAAEGLLALAEGEPETAIALLGHLERLGEAGGPALVAVRLWDADLVEALVSVGDLDAARRVVAGLAHSPSTTWTVATQQRCLALVSGDVEAGLEAAMASSEAFGAIGAPLEQARSELLAGTLAVRANHSSVARSLLQRAQRTFDALGATRWSAATALELSRLSVKPDTPSDPLVALTSQERDLAVLVARGVTNRDAATALFVSVKTIEAHLARIYRKVGVGTRTQLAALVLRWSRDELSAGACVAAENLSAR